MPIRRADLPEIAGNVVQATDDCQREAVVFFDFLLGSGCVPAKLREICAPPGKSAGIRTK
jgi:hypothetical protein